jgi:hypothetical protein
MPTRRPLPAVAPPLLALAVLAAACGGAPARVARFAAPPRVDPVDQYRQAVRHAAYARVAARAGEDARAYASFRAALRLHGDAQWAIEAARSAERAGLLGEAHDTWRWALRLADEGERGAIAREVERTAGLVPADAQRVAVIVHPAGARLELVREGSDQVRPLVGDDTVWLLPGRWRAEDPVDPEAGALASWRIGEAGPRLLAVALRRAPPSDVAPPQRVAAPTGPARPDPALARPTPPRDPAPAAGEPKRPEPAPRDAAPTDPGPGQPPAAAPDQGSEPPGQPALAGVHRWGPYATAGLGLAAAGAATWFGIQALQYAQIANDLDPDSAKYKANLKTYGDGAEQNALRANVAFAVGGALVAGGAAWWLLRPAPRSSISLQAAAPPGEPLRLAPPPSFKLALTGRSVLAAWRF